MPGWTNLGDFTTASLPNTGGRGRQGFRPSNAVNTYTLGTVVQLVPVSGQIYPDFQTVQPTPAAAGGTKLAGVVASDWGGFDGQGSLNSSYISAALQTNIVGTQFINTVVKGITYVWIDQSGGAAVTCVDGLPLSTSSVTAGYAQGSSLVLTAGAALVGVANLPASAVMGYSLTAAALAQASGTVTITGTPASGDVLTVTLGPVYTDLQPGTVQTHSISVTLNATTAASVTTAATALAAALNADSYFATPTVHGTGGWFIATSSAGVVTITVNAFANAWLVTGGTTSGAGNAQEQYRFYTFISGMIGNSITLATTASAGAGSIVTASGANLASGTGYKGKVPAMIYGMY
jgi:hypothetical protein